MEKQFNFVYITTNIVNGKQYVGDHSTNNLNDGYLGSGILLSKDIKKYKRKIFKKKIFEFFNTKKEAFDAQEKYINEYNTLSPNGYNISPMGGNCVQKCHSEETLKKMGNSNKGKIRSKEFKDNVSKFHKGRKRLEETKKKISIANKGKKRTKEMNEENRKRNLGKNNPNYGLKRSEETKRKMSLKQLGNKNHMFGKHRSKEVKEKISSTLRNKIIKKLEMVVN